MSLIIYGNGTMAKLLFSYARHSMDIVGFTVDDSCISENSDSFCGLPLVQFSKVQEVFAPAKHKMIIAVGFIEMNDLRERKYQEAKGKGYLFEKYVHESVFMHEDVSIEDNCIILDFVSIHPDTKIGQGTFISSNVNIGHTCTIGTSNWISAGVSIAGGCRIGSGCFFGVNSSVGHGVTVGIRNFIAANTLINKNTKDEEVYLSEPGQLSRLKSRFFLKFSRVLG
jgi:sugar O-acyltransferase (sialic acid O-acetyltransferase NeuD family)